MTTSDAAVALSDSAARQGSRWRLQLSAGYLAIPMLVFLSYFFFYPAIVLLFSSIQTQNSQGIIGRPFTLAHYARLIDVDLYAGCSGIRCGSA
jgi:putative spermidine/putrescine transport system permease protein